MCLVWSELDDELRASHGMGREKATRVGCWWGDNGDPEEELEEGSRLVGGEETLRNAARRQTGTGRLCGGHERVSLVERLFTALLESNGIGSFFPRVFPK